jgi:serine/threonine protein phosphatase PrpC
MLLHLAAEAHTVIRLTAISAEKEPHATLCALIIKKQYAIWAHAGDSRLYFFRSGKLVHQTEDQTYAQQLREEGRHEDAEIAAQRYKNILVSALGINKKPKIVIGEEHSLRVGDVFLLASDGMWAYFENDELAHLLNDLSPRDASEEMMSLARERAEGRGDNLSLAIVKLEPPPRTRG